MILKPFLIAALSMVSMLALAGDPVTFDTSWIQSKPEVRTYRTSSKRWGDGYFQVCLWKSESGLEIAMNILTPTYSKFLHGLTAPDLRPVRSKGVIVIGDQVVMESSISYEGEKVRISTLVKPYNRTTANELESKGLVIDPAVIPILPRLLPLKPGSTFSFTSLDPVTNSLGTYTLKVTAEEIVRKIPCRRAETTSFEGNSIVWVEKAAPHRILKIETPGQAGVNELIQ